MRIPIFGGETSVLHFFIITYCISTIFFFNLFLIYMSETYIYIFVCFIYLFILEQLHEVKSNFS